MRLFTQSSLVLAAALIAGCSESPTQPDGDRHYDVVAGNDNGVVIDVGEYGVPFGVFIRDAANQLVLYYRWNDGFPCLGQTATQFVQSSYRDVIRANETWRTVDKTAELWFYVYDWDGTSALNCAFIQAHTPLASGRGSRLLLDNDYFPVAPYGPGPGANAYTEQYRGSLTGANGEPVQFSGQLHATIAADGFTVRHWQRTLHLSPDPRN